MASNTLEIKHVLTFVGLQTTSLEQCVPLSVGNVPTMNKEDLSRSVWVYASSYKIFYTTVEYVPLYIIAA